MKKEGIVFTLFVICILLISVSFVSAGLLGDVWNKITGKLTESETEEPEPEPLPPEEEVCCKITTVAPGMTGAKIEYEPILESECPPSELLDGTSYEIVADEYCVPEIPPEPPPGEKCEEGKIRYYVCEDGAKIPECICENDAWVCRISVKDDCPDVGPEPETCATKIQITSNKDVYKIGDDVKIIIEVFDSQGNHLPNYAFYGQMYDNIWHTPDLQKTDDKGYFIITTTAEKPGGGVTEVKFKVYTKEISSCSSVEDTIEVRIELEECGFGECAPEPECEDKVRKCGGVCPPCPEDDGDREIFYPCSGCELEGKCYPYGFRKAENYCSDENDLFLVQSGDDEKCENNFECETNLCINGNCVSSNVWNKFLEWFKKIFGGDGEIEPKDCSKLLIEKDIEDWEYLDSIYGTNKHTQVPVYSKDGKYLETLKCCMAGYAREETNEEKASLVCQYDNRQDLENSLYWIIINERDLDLEFGLAEYKDQKVYGSSDVAIVWTSKTYLVASGGDPRYGTPLSEAITDAYLKKYKNDLKEVDFGELPPVAEPQSCEEIQDNIGQANCYIVLAIAESDTSICEKIIYNKDHRNKCYVELAQHTAESNVCEKIIDDNSLKEKCYFWVAGQEEEDVCPEIADSDLHEFCYVEVAKKTGDASFCDKITDSHLADKCYRDLGMRLNDRSLCEKIVEEQARQKCFDNTS